jgi:hypothetical protein
VEPLGFDKPLINYIKKYFLFSFTPVAAAFSCSLALRTRSLGAHRTRPLPYPYSARFAHYVRVMATGSAPMLTSFAACGARGTACDHALLRGEEGRRLTGGAAVR